MIEALGLGSELKQNVLKGNELKTGFDPDKRIDIVKRPIERIGHFIYDPDKRIEIRKPDKDGFYTTFEERSKISNLDNREGGLRGFWEGERANSTFIPSYKFMQDRLAEFGLKGIDFRNGEADFSKVSVASVKIDHMSAFRLGKGNNFDQANTKLAEKFNKERKDGRNDWTPREVDTYIEDNKLSRHERCDCKTIDLVPTDIHKYFHHSGGVAECKARDGVRGEFDE